MNTLLNKLKKNIVALIVIFSLIFSYTLASASSEKWVSTESTISGDNNSIYVAGCPDKYPVEFFEDGEYKGLSVYCYEYVGEEIEQNFTYISGSGNDKRLELLENSQVDIVTFTGDEIDIFERYIKDYYKICSLKEEKKNTDLYIGFSKIANDNDISKITESLDRLTDSDIHGFLSTIANSEKERNSTVTVIAMSTVFLVIVTALVIWRILSINRRKKEDFLKKQEENNPIIWVRDRFDRYFNNINPAERSIYCINYLSFNTQKGEELYGYPVVEAQIKMAEEIIDTHLDKLELCVKTNDGFIIMNAASSDSENIHLYETIIEELNSRLVTHDDVMNYRVGMYRVKAIDSDPAKCVTYAKQGFDKAYKEHRSYVVFDDEMIRISENTQNIVNTVNRAFENNEFKLYLQLIVDSGVDRIVGAEALTRWDSPEKGLLHPKDYIKILEDNGYIYRLDMYMFEQDCRELEKWMKNSIGWFISCNFARETISTGSFVDDILSIADRYKIDRTKLVIEITEDVLEFDKNKALENIVALKNAGFTIALDDVGSGKTTFSDITSYPISIFKIDKTVVENSFTEKGRKLLKGIVTLAHNLEMTVLCEGVETFEEYKNIVKLGTDYIQGYLFFRPMPAEEILKMRTKIDRKDWHL